MNLSDLGRASGQPRTRVTAPRFRGVRPVHCARGFTSCLRTRATRCEKLRRPCPTRFPCARARTLAGNARANTPDLRTHALPETAWSVAGRRPARFEEGISGNMYKVCVRGYVCAWSCVCMCVRLRLRVCVCVRACACVCLLACVRACVCGVGGWGGGRARARGVWGVRAIPSSKRVAPSAVCTQYPLPTSYPTCLRADLHACAFCATCLLTVDRSTHCACDRPPTRLKRVVFVVHESAMMRAPVGPHSCLSCARRLQKVLLSVI